VPNPEFIGNGICNGIKYMSTTCSIDGGDCDLCLDQISSSSIDSANIGDGYCDLELNTTACGWDGLDCLKGFGSDPECQVPDKSKLGDGLCDGGFYNTEACGHDHGDCKVCNSKVSTPSRIGTFRTIRFIYYFRLHFFRSGPLSHSSKSDKTGDGICDGYKYLKVNACNNDGGDCNEFVDSYPDCDVPRPNKVGNGYCGKLYWIAKRSRSFSSVSCSNFVEIVSDGGDYFTAACGWDGDDCAACAAANMMLIGNGICNGGETLTDACSFDGGDCEECFQLTGADPSSIGDGYCDIALNTTGCGYDGFDCLDGFGSNPTCRVPDKSKLGDGRCDGGVYNTEACDYDNGDCLVCNSKVKSPKRIGRLHFLAPQPFKSFLQQELTFLPF